MKKILFGLFIAISLLFSSSIDKKIRANKRELRKKEIEYDKMDKKLSSIAKKIIDAKSQIAILDKKLKKSEKNIQNNQTKLDKLNIEKDELDREIAELKDKIKDKEDKFISLVADKFSIALVLDEIKKPTPKSVMLQEIYHVYSKENEKKIKKLREEIIKLSEKEDYLIFKQQKLQKLISKYQKQKEEYLAQKKKKLKLVKELARDKAIYKKRFDAIRASKRNLRKRLAKLQIIKQDNQEDYVQEVTPTPKKKHKKRRRRHHRTASYNGGKTISPLSGSVLIKKFGTYIDPIYKFRIFNKSITLKAPYQGAKVKSVLSGKVVFAENSGGMLGKVVIIAHDNNLHTIYAKLSRLAPGIHAGKRVAKGTVIGKVDNVLMFEVTKNNKHINPLKLIKL